MLQKKQSSKISYPNPYNEGEFFTPDNVSLGQQNINRNIPLGLGTPQPTPRPSMPMNMPAMEEPEQDSTNFLGSLLAQGTAMLGAGIQGGDVGQVGRSFEAGRQRAEQDRKAKALVDPKSEESKRRRMVFQKAMGFDIPEEYSATDLNDPVVLQSIRDKKMQELPPKGGTGIGIRGGVGQAKPEKEKKNPFQKEITEVDNRATMTIDALDQLKENVEKYGTYNVIGPQNNIRNQLVTSIAADYNKVKDPNSTVRGEEAKAVADNLGLTMFSSKESAIASIEAFKKLVQKQKNTSISKYENLPSQAIFDDSDRFIIQEYRNNPNDPKIKETYNNMLESKGMSGF
jgi:hypothetical protein